MLTSDPTVQNTWVFVSHASADLPRVREVRNYLESKGGSPLLFHLRSLKRPEEFRPLIMREIEARNFFLYCESPAAEISADVQWERSIVAAASKGRPIRVGSTSVTGSPDRAGLDAFLAHTRVFPTFNRSDRAKVDRFLRALSDAEFRVFDELTIEFGEAWQTRINSELESAAREGWVLLFVTASSSTRSWGWHDIDTVMRLHARVVPVLLEGTTMFRRSQQLASINAFDATVEPETAPQRLVAELLRRP